MLLSELTAHARRLALVGLAKNTGKTETLAALLRELERAGRTVGVTSVGRDGEERDVIDVRIEKPRVRLREGSVVATTEGLLRASGLPHELLAHTGVRTPLGPVAIARLRAPGTIEVAGPSAARDVRAVSDAMLAAGVEQVLIDGAIDRRAASSPQVADAIVMSTGAVLSPDIARVVQRTRDAVDLVRLPTVAAEPAARAALASAAGGTSVLLDEDGSQARLAPRFVLTSDAEAIGAALDASRDARWLIVEGALPEEFLRGLVQAARRRGRRIEVVVADPTHAFLSERGPQWYRRQGVELRAARTTELTALTVNPLAPRSHRFDSAQLRALLSGAIPGLPVFDVLHPDYPGVPQPAPA